MSTINTSVLSPDQLRWYNNLRSKLPLSINEEDLDIYTALLAVVFDCVEYRLTDTPGIPDIDYAGEVPLRESSVLIGYQWDYRLSTEVNRMLIKSYTTRRKIRGTPNSIRNIVRASQSLEDYYSNSINTNIEVIENGPYINVILPDGALVRGSDIEQVRPAGTSLRFIYIVNMGYADFEFGLLDDVITVTYNIPLSGYTDLSWRAMGLDNKLKSFLDEKLVYYSTDNPMIVDVDCSQYQLVSRLTSSRGTEFSSLDYLYNDDYVPSTELISLEQDYWNTTGTQEFVNDETTSNPRGFTSENLSDDSGNFNEDTYIKIDYPGIQTLTYLEFSSYSTIYDFTITVYYHNNLVGTRHITDNTLTDTRVDISDIAKWCDSIMIKFNRSVPNQRCRILSIKSDSKDSW